MKKETLYNKKRFKINKQKKIIRLKDFVKTGAFDQLKVGVSTKQDLIDLMGTDFDFGDGSESQIIKYGWYEFFFWTKTGILFGIQNDHLQDECADSIEYENEQVKIDNWFLEPEKVITFAEVVEILKHEDISYKLEKENYESALDYMRLANGVTIDFDTDFYEPKEMNAWILNGIRHFKIET